jgi:tryptophan synthase beta chain
MDSKRILLSGRDLPTAWYNLAADLPKECPPPLHPGTHQPVTPADLAAIFPPALIEQEMTRERWIEIPSEVREVLAHWRPTPLVRAHRLERALKTPARIYFKDESVSPPGSHKPNTAVAQVWYNKQAGVTRLVTETGAGQWGTSLAFACSLLGAECKVYMVRCSYEQKPYRRSMMHVWGATVLPSPTRETQAGRSVLEKDPDCPGSLGIAISEAVEEAASREDSNYALGSVLNHVMLHQTVIGLEAEAQMKQVDDYPDVVIGCVGGGSNFAGLAFPFMRRRITEGRETRFVAAEPRACPSMSRGKYRYDYGDTTKLTPLVKMHTLGHGFIPAGIHAGGLRYHGMAPLVSLAAELGLVEAAALYQNPVFEAARLFAATEGIIPAPESAHAVRAAIDEALRCRQTGREECILFNLSGHGICDLASYERHLSGELEDFEYPQAEIERAMSELPEVG